MITGDGDRLIPPELSTQIAEGIPQASLTVLTGAGHLTNIEAPERFTELLHGHLTQCGGVA